MSYGGRVSFKVSSPMFPSPSVKSNVNSPTESVRTTNVRLLISGISEKLLSGSHPTKIRTNKAKAIMYLYTCIVYNLSVASIIENLSKSPSEFETIALNVFQYQYKYNAVYKAYCHALHINETRVKSFNDIPFLPIQFFKNMDVVTFKETPEITFTSSGTGGVQSRHLLKSISDYNTSFMAAWKHFFDDAKDYEFLALLPAYSERTGSSLIYMVDSLMQASGQANKRYYLNHYKDLHEHYTQALARGKKVVLFGVTFALLELCDSNYTFPKALIFETGGMKGRGKELIRDELHLKLNEGLQCPNIYSEYGMTELLTQAYATDGKNFSCPPWMKIIMRQSDDPFDYNNRKTSGGINVIDLANLHSCAFIETQDLGKKQGDFFQVLGRFDQSDLRGCNLMVSE